MNYEIIDGHNSYKLLKWTKDDNSVTYVGIDLKNRDYQAFLTWNSEQQEPLTLPEDWPTNE